jgi:hypothetical protein
MHRRNYRYDRVELDQEAYRHGFLNGYEAGACAAFEYIQTGEFTYSEFADPLPPDSIFDQQENARHKTATYKLAYEVGYADSFGPRLF